jgi:hypothetical protein
MVIKSLLQVILEALNNLENPDALENLARIQACDRRASQL